MAMAAKSTKKHSLLSKFNMIFDKSPEWISFKPKLGFKVYPCYSCKNMFSSKVSFQDHINRRVIVIKYKCTYCTNVFTFYNRCSLLLHARKHFSLGEGIVNLAHLEITQLPVDLAGFARHDNIPFLYDEEEEFVDKNSYVNAQFYNADDSEAGKQIIHLKPFNLVFHYVEGNSNILMVLKQITNNIPLCEFVSQSSSKPKNAIAPLITKVTPTTDVSIKKELEEDDFTMPIISKIESLNNEPKATNSCPECKAVMQSIKLPDHIMGTNKPLDDNIVCKKCNYIASTKCSLKAHVRIHDSAAPFVCPECGKAFNSFQELNGHMDRICFHLTKQVRFRCPALKCGKLFVSPKTYSFHFASHFQCVQLCTICNVALPTDVIEHNRMHPVPSVVKSYICTVCKNLTLTEDQYRTHLKWHLDDKERRVYIFTCKFCRSSFRSNATYAVHKARCLKYNNITVTSQCQFCKQKLIFRERDTEKMCGICKEVNYLYTDKPSKNGMEKTPHQTPKSSSSNKCMLCKEEITESTAKAHAKACKYNNPVVTIQVLSGDESKDSDETSKSERLSTSYSEPSSLDISSDSSRNEESSRKKRKRPSAVNTRSKKSNVDVSVDLQAEKPVSFDGTYYCRLCSFKTSQRPEFHEHIVKHRDVSTSYQCMECGECFVVKPSLIKHLLHFHKITDPNAYLAKNDCCDKGAIKELQNQQNLVPGEHKGPVKENQCTVCLEQFEDSVSLSKHFRIHGMAFLMKKAK